MLHSTCPQPNGIRDRDAGARAVRDHDEPVEPEKIATPVRLRIEALPNLSCRRPNESSADLPAERRLELGAQRVEKTPDGSLERLQRYVAREAVRHDDVGPTLEERAPLHVPAEAEIGLPQELVRVDGELVPLLVLL